MPKFTFSRESMPKFTVSIESKPKLCSFKVPD